MSDIIRDLFVIAVGVFILWSERGGGNWSSYKKWGPSIHRFMMGVGVLAVLAGALFLIVDSLQLLF